MDTAPSKTAIMSGRTKQKERTRQALLRATRDLFEEGVTPTIARAAKRAGVSEATAYRYYSEVRSLMQDSVNEQWPELETIVQELRGMDLAQDRAEHAAKAMAQVVLANEAKIRTLIALSYRPAPSRQPVEAGKARPAFRLLLIETVLEPVKQVKTKRQRELLRNALSVVIAAEAVLSMKDALNTNERETIAALGWSARCMVAAFEQDGRKTARSAH